MQGYLELFIYSLIVLGFTGLLLIVLTLLGSLMRRSTPQKLMAYESGAMPVGNARVRFPIPFYLIAMLFLVFDVAAAFLFPWALVHRTLGAPGLGKVCLFVGILLLSYLYAWKRGAFRWL